MTFSSHTDRKALLRYILFSLFLFAANPAFSQKQEQDRPAPIEPGQGATQAQKLVQEILQQRPGEFPTNATLKIRSAAGTERSLPVRMDITQTATNWTQVYRTLPGKSEIPANGESLTIVHTYGKPSRYFLATNGQTNATELSGNQTMVPFAGSDFWVADLGLEFLHWPKQRLVKKEMHYHKSCVMLESINPAPTKSGYARVDSWMTIEKPHNPVMAKAYDATGKQIKVFTPEGIEKVEGTYKPSAIEMRNLKEKTRSLIEFDWGD